MLSDIMKAPAWSQTCKISRSPGPSGALCCRIAKKGEAGVGVDLYAQGNQSDHRNSFCQPRHLRCLLRHQSSSMITSAREIGTKRKPAMRFIIY